MTQNNYLEDEVPFWIGKVDQDWSLSTHDGTTVTMELLWQCDLDDDHQDGDDLMFYEDPGTFTEISADTIVAKVSEVKRPSVVRDNDL